MLIIISKKFTLVGTVSGWGWGQPLGLGHSVGACAPLRGSYLGLKVENCMGRVSWFMTSILVCVYSG